MRILFIINPAAGVRTRQAAQALGELQLPQSVAADVATTARAGDAEGIAANAAKDGYDVIAAVGGDGTVNEVGRGLLGQGRAQLAIVPTGSGNGVARHLGIPMEPRQAIRHMLAATPTAIDVGFINGAAFFCAAGVGFDAHVSRHFAQSKTRGLIGYSQVALQAYGGYRPSRIEVRTEDGGRVTNCYMLALANASQYGNNAYIAPGADLSDGLLDMCLIDDLPLWRALRVSYGLAVGDLPQSGVAEFRRVRELAISAEQPLEYHADGEFLGAIERFEVTVRPRAITIRA